MFPIVVGRGGGRTWLTILLNCLVRAIRLVNPVRKSLGLLAIAGVWMFLIFCFAARCLRRCPGSCVMSEYGVPEYFSGLCPPSEVFPGLDVMGMGTGSSVDWL